jgi:hypothetical protein
MIKEQNCLFSEIKLEKQKVSKQILHELLYNVYNNVCFSTFPYLVYKESNSLNCVKKYNSGNCIAFSYFIKNYLKSNFNVTSYIIGASVPNLFKVDGTPHICHCAILIPISNYEFYIIDCALYFLEPIYCDVRQQSKGTINSSNVHNHEISMFSYMFEHCDSVYLDSKYDQKLLPNCTKVKCWFSDDSTQTWNYYLNELKNPDNNVGASFLIHKPEPFLMYTIFQNGIVKMLYKIEYKDGLLNIKKYPEKKELYNGTTYDNNVHYNKIKQELYKYFEHYMI